MATTHQERETGVEETERPLSEHQSRSGATKGLRLLALLAAMLATLGFGFMALVAVIGLIMGGGAVALALLTLSLLALLGMLAAAVLLFGRDRRWSIRLSAACAVIGLTAWLMLDPLNLTLHSALGYLAFFVGPSLVVLGLGVWLRRRTAGRPDVTQHRGRGINRRRFLALLTGSSVLTALGYLGLRVAWPNPRDESVPDQPRPGVVIYDARATGFAQWAGGPGWRRVNGLLVADGTEAEDLLGPFATAGVNNYAVEAEIKVDQDAPYSDGKFGVIARSAEFHSGYRAGLDFLDGGRAFIYGYPVEERYQGYLKGLPATHLIAEPFPTDHAWHTYRFEAYGKALSLLIDGRLITHTTDTVSVDGPGTGLFCAGCQISVRNFKVIALS